MWSQLHHVTASFLNWKRKHKYKPANCFTSSVSHSKLVRSKNSYFLNKEKPQQHGWLQPGSGVQLQGPAMATTPQATESAGKVQLITLAGLLPPHPRASWRFQAGVSPADGERSCAARFIWPNAMQWVRCSRVGVFWVGQRQAGRRRNEYVWF